jgi:hypothetical protein
MRRTLNVIRSVVVVLGLGAVAYSGSALVAVPRRVGLLQLVRGMRR